MKTGLYKNTRHIIHSLNIEVGLSLVETLLAIAIMGICGATFISGLSAGSIAVRMQDESSVAQGLAQDQIEAIQAAGYDVTGATYNPVSAPAGYSISIGTNSGIYSNNRIQKITVTITHNSNSILVMEDYKVNR